jgi:sporulation protein YlmC with PRC-barrel domain
MFRLCNIRKAFVAVLVFVVASLQIASTARAQTNAGIHRIDPLRARALLGMDIEDNDGRQMGKLRDLAFNARDGKVLYAIVASGGLLGVRTKLRAIPPGVLSAATAKRNTLAFHATTERWQEAPTFKASDIASLARPERVREIYRHFGKRPPDMKGHALTPTGDTGKAPVASKSIELILASDIVGTSVFDLDHIKVGTVLDLLVSFDEKHSAFVIFSAGELFKDQGHHFAVPLQAMIRTSDENVNLPVTRTIMERAQSFSKVSWEQTGSDEAPIVFRFPVED